MTRPAPLSHRGRYSRPTDLRESLLTSQSPYRRPPRLSRHFCSVDLPLDLDDSVLTGPSEALQEAVAKLDVNGWNTEGAYRPVVRQRMNLLLCPIREEALELTIGPAMPDVESKAR
jgi:hypothetical protein